MSSTRPKRAGSDSQPAAHGSKKARADIQDGGTTTSDDTVKTSLDIPLGSQLPGIQNALQIAAAISKSEFIPVIHWLLPIL
ncbi:hypothetical protein D9758_005090 [Tetrapyrgos nigripes]|uniref:Uncharacterized protein n=1 Tax=Tetrapyrgos nigripes TaxID=182062 RepID=A0A8H5GW48_9AGAR|nr:hypothetical protein D9758_005090 [Tetrapyrgos nigripes]